MNAGARRLTAALLLGSSTASLTACGCDAVGYPAVEVHAIDFSSTRPVPLGGATIAYGTARQAGYQGPFQGPDSSSMIWICCTPGDWRIQINQTGYQPYETTVRVKSSGSCDRPVLVRLTARLRAL